MYPANLSSRYTDLYFTTATVKDWKPLLRPDKYKQIIMDSFAFLVREETVWIYAFVIMPNHFHWVWQLRGDQHLSLVQLRLLKFVAQQLKFDLVDNHPAVLEHFKVRRNDRRYQFFKERPLSIPLFTDSVTWQKIRYIHENPTQPRWKLSLQAEDYKWSSAAFYTHGDPTWSFLTHFWYGDDWPLLTSG